MNRFFLDIESLNLRRSFLKDVCLSLRYDSHDLKDADIERLDDFGREAFGLDHFYDNLKSNTECNIKSDDDLIFFSFSASQLSIKVKIPRYQRFSEDITVHFGMMLGFLEIIGVSEIQEMSVTKFNELSFKSSEPIDIKVPMKSVFSSNLLDNDSEFSDQASGFNELFRWEKLLTIDEPADSVRVNIVFGFSKANDGSNSGSLILRPSVTSISRTIQTGEIKSIAEKINHICNNVFYWCISEDTKAALTNE